MRYPMIPLLCLAATLAAQDERMALEAAGGLKTDDRAAIYETLARYKPDDLHYQTALAGTFLQKMRETMDPGYLDRASRIVDSVLDREAGNYEALRLRSAIELERHNFSAVARYSRELIRAAPDEPWNWGTLGDALMERGEYAEAAEAYQTMVRLRPDLASYNRAAYYRFVAGDAPGAIEIMKQAIAAGSRAPENVAWCLADLGNMYFKTGQVEAAGRAYTAALGVFANYHPAHAGLGRVRAAQGQTVAAVESYLRAQGSVPLPEYAVALEDLYTVLGRAVEARRQRERLDLAARMEAAAGQTTNRNLALAFADHDRRLDEALALARAETKVRGDVYTWDALAWALYKNREFGEAGKASAKALALGTPEPAFHYHAGMIAKAMGDAAGARRELERALALNPHFDVRQAGAARAALREMADETHSR